MRSGSSRRALYIVPFRHRRDFRRFCAKLYLKGETQQIDRILSEFSRRYWECNPTSLYGSASKSLLEPRRYFRAHPSTGVVHAVSYSILLLNTDLHVADLSTHMSRNQFVRNTVQAIQSQIRPSGPAAARSSTPDLTYDDGSSAHARSEGSEFGGSTVRPRPKRSSSVHSWTSVSREVLSPLGTPGTSTGQLTTSPTGQYSLNASTASVQTPTSGQVSTSAEPRIRTAANQSSSSVASVVYGRNWDVEMEGMLRVSDGLLLFTARRGLIACSGHVRGDQERGDPATNRLPAAIQSDVHTRS